jgi:hypothetical protein
MNKQLIEPTYNTWYHYKYNLKNRVLTTLGIENVCKDFSNNVLQTISQQEILMIQMKICLKDGSFKSISKVEIFTSSQSNKILEYFKDQWSIKNEHYFHFEIHYVIISYNIIKPLDKISQQKVNKVFKEVSLSSQDYIPENKTENSSFNFSGYNLPTTMDITTWGACVFNKDYSKAIISKTNSKQKYEVYLNERSLTVNLLNSSGDKILSWEDSIINKDDLTYFSRYINNQEYIYENNNIILKMIQRKCDKIKPSKKRFLNSKKFLTMDIETLISNKENDKKGKYQLLIPYCISTYDGKLAKSFYLLDYLSKDKTITD